MPIVGVRLANDDKYHAQRVHNARLKHLKTLFLMWTLIWVTLRVGEKRRRERDLTSTNSDANTSVR